MSKKQELKAPENPIWLDGSGYKVCLSKQAEKVKAELLESSSRILSVSDPDSALIAKAQRDDINKMLIDVEKVRKLVKQPVIDKGKEIDQTAANFTEELTEEKNRLDSMIGAFAMAQEKIRREAAERAQREAAEALRKQQEAEEAERKAHELRMRAAQSAADAETARERMLADQARQKAEEEQRKADALARQAGQSFMGAHQASLTVMDNPKTKGTSVVLDYEVQDIQRVYECAPHLVELTPKRRDILAFLNGQKLQGLPVGLPGLKIVEKAAIRS